MTSEAVLPSAPLRSGPAAWLDSTWAMLRWHLVSMRRVLPVLIVVQAMIGAGFSVGMSMFFTEVTPRIGLFLGTGVAVIMLILVGLVVAPQLVASEKDAGTYDFTWSLPVPRSSGVVAWVVLTAVVSVPAMVAALAVAAWRLGIDYTLSWAIVPAVVLVLVGGTMIGYGLAHAIERTSITQVLSQLFAFGVLGFTPIMYPPENLPTWLARVHEVLPFYHMGVIIRGALTEGLVDDVGTSYAIVAAWSVAAIVLTALVLGRRR